MKDFIEQAIRTESKDFAAITGRISTRNVRLLHSFLGLVTEVGELVDILKKHLYYGKKIDKVHMAEESGDILWYIAILFHEMGWDFEFIAHLVITKLKKRYPNHFTNIEAINRKPSAERDQMEKTFTERIEALYGE